MDIRTETGNRFENGSSEVKERKGVIVTKEEIGVIICCKKILKRIGHGQDLNIKSICKDIGLSRKSAYKYESQSEGIKADKEDTDIEGLKSENEQLKVRLKRVELENKGLLLTKMLVEDLKKKGY